MKLVHTDKSKDALKKYGDLWKKIKSIIRSTSNRSDNYFEKYLKIRFNSDDELPLKKTLELHNIILAVRSVFREHNKHNPKIFSDECLYKLA